MCVIVAFVPYYAQMQTLRKIDVAGNVEEIKLIYILASINNCPIYNQPEFCHHEASGLATISVFPLGVRNMGAFPYIHHRIFGFFGSTAFDGRCLPFNIVIS